MLDIGAIMTILLQQVKFMIELSDQQQLATEETILKRYKWLILILVLVIIIFDVPIFVTFSYSKALL